MADTICWARLESLTDTIAALPTNKETLTLLERVPMVWLEEDARINGLRLEPFDPAVNFNLWERGRIFNPIFELRWEQVDGFFQAIYCGQEVNLPGFQLAEEPGLSTLSSKTRSYFLWGTRVKEDDLGLIGLPTGTQVFVELQVPRLLRYPVSPQAKRVKLQVCEYRDVTGTLVYYRFQKLEEVHESI